MLVSLLIRTRNCDTTHSFFGVARKNLNLQGTGSRYPSLKTFLQDVRDLDKFKWILTPAPAFTD